MIALAIGVALGFAAPPGDVIHSKEKTFRIPIELTEAELAHTTAVRLFFSVDEGRTWTRYRSESKRRPNITFRAERDGLYWFALGLIGEDGLMTPRDPADLRPGLKVLVDCTKPEATMEAVRSRSGLRGVRWTVTDLAPAESLAMHFALWDEKKGCWKPRSLSAVKNSTLWFEPQEEVSRCQLQVRDLAGNETVLQLEIEGDLFHTTPQATFALATEAPGREEAVRPSRAVDEESNTKLASATEPAVGETTRPKAKRADAVVSERSERDEADAAPPSRPRTKPAKEAPPPSEEEDLPPKTTPTTRRTTAAKPPAEEPAPPPAETAAVERTYSNKRSANLHYELDAAQGVTVEGVELWGTTNNGKTWVKLGSDPDCRSPMDATFPRDGLWGIRLAVLTEGRDGTPKPGASPSSYVEVDTVAPVVSPPKAVFERDWLRIRWTAKDRNLAPDSARLSFAVDPRGPWEVIATQLKANDEFSWKPRPEQAESPLYFRVEVQDKAGNVGAADSATPVVREGEQPPRIAAGRSKARVVPAGGEEDDAPAPPPRTKRPAREAQDRE